jgi:outer membrane immunogenic protein
MNKLVRGCFALALILIFTTPGFCKELTTYMSINTGVALLEDSDVTDSTLPGMVATYEYDPGYFVGLAVGNHVDHMRFEAEVGYQKNKVDSVRVNGVSFTSSGDQEIRLSTLLFNFYYDFMKGSRFTPYLSAGLGLGNMKLDNAGKSDAVAEYQFGAGVAFRITDSFALDFKGRYLGTTDAEFGTTSLDFTTINAIFDVRFYF